MMATRPQAMRLVEPVVHVAPSSQVTPHLYRSAARIVNCCHWCLRGDDVKLNIDLDPFGTDDLAVMSVSGRVFEHVSRT